MDDGANPADRLNDAARRLCDAIFSHERLPRLTARAARIDAVYLALSPWLSIIQKKSTAEFPACPAARRQGLPLNTIDLVDNERADQAMSIPNWRAGASHARGESGGGGSHTLLLGETPIRVHSGKYIAVPGTPTGLKGI
jgi:hypothetical protein